jgi:hypothetical protein
LWNTIRGTVREAVTATAKIPTESCPWVRHLPPPGVVILGERSLVMFGCALSVALDAPAWWMMQTCSFRVKEFLGLVHRQLDCNLIKATMHSCTCRDDSCENLICRGNRTFEFI